MKVTNSEVTQAKEALTQLQKQKLPLKTSWNVAQLINKLNDPINAFVSTRDAIFQKYEIKQEKGEQEGTTQFTSEVEGNVEKFVAEFNELLGLETDIICNKIKIPEKIASTCDKCHHNMDKVLEIEPEILVPLIKFVEVIDA